MVTQNACFKKYGDPVKEKNMVVWAVPADLWFAPLPKKIYMNADMVEPFTAALVNIKDRGLQKEVKTWGGCFNIRIIRGGWNASLHSWGIAFDINAEENPLGAVPKMSPALVKCFTDAGFDWGGTFTRKDGMHFQLAKI